MVTKVEKAGSVNPATWEGHKTQTPHCDGRDYGSKRGAGGVGAYPLGSNAGAAHGGNDENKIRREQDRYMTRPESKFHADQFPERKGKGKHV